MLEAQITHDAVDLAPGAARTLHLLDIENLMETTTFVSQDVERVMRRYRRVAGVGTEDQFIIASSHHTAAAAWFGFPQGRRLVKSGPDGADLALLEVLATENVATRFDRIVVASGDGIFATSCGRLQAMGCAVTVVSRRPSSLAKRLAFAVRDTRFIDPAHSGGLAALRRAA